MGWNDRRLIFIHSQEHIPRYEHYFWCSQRSGFFFMPNWLDFPRYGMLQLFHCRTQQQHIFPIFICLFAFYRFRTFHFISFRCPYFSAWTFFKFSTHLSYANNLSDFITVIAVYLFIHFDGRVICVYFDLPNTLTEIIYIISWCALQIYLPLLLFLLHIPMYSLSRFLPVFIRMLFVYIVFVAWAYKRIDSFALDNIAVSILLLVLFDFLM